MKWFISLFQPCPHKLRLRMLRESDCALAEAEASADAACARVNHLRSTRDRLRGELFPIPAPAFPVINPSSNGDDF